jgi:hypothetical protein
MMVVGGQQIGLAIWFSLATKAEAMVPPAPGLLSTMTLAPSSRAKGSLIKRANISCAEPAENGTTKVVTRDSAPAILAHKKSQSHIQEVSRLRMNFKRDMGDVVGFQTFKS